MNRGSKKDIGNALMSKLKSSSAATKYERSSDDDIWNIWSNQTKIRKKEEITKLKEKKNKNSKNKARITSLKTKRPPSLSKNKKKWAAVIVGAGVIVFANTRGNPVDKNKNTAVLGDQAISTPVELPREKPGFDLLYPNSESRLDLEVVRISPEGAAASYTYIYQIINTPETKINLTQQEVPDNFELSKVATEFQATDIIQVDDNIIYHGYSEKTGVQSVLFIKDKILAIIRSPNKLSDDVWASFYLSLKQ